MYPTVKQIEYFLTLSNVGSLSKAAAIIGITQPALSRQLGELEKSLGLRFFDRNGRGIVLTDDGQAFLEHAHKIIGQMQSAVADMQARHEKPRGRIRVGLPPRVANEISTELVMLFREKYPEASISISEALSLPLREWLIAGRIDLAVLFSLPQTPQLFYKDITSEELVLVSSTRLPYEIPFEKLPEFPLVLPSFPHSVRHLIEGISKPRDLILNIVAEVDSMQSILPLVQHGVASAIVPSGALRQWRGRTAPQVASIIEPSIRNRLVVAMAVARPSTPLTRFTQNILEKLVRKNYG
jgi:LysR family transcriptional regulator, nitrogen assimilation regulatory protein|uniref:LysR family transcriptional regulator n=1 Tax=Orrella sp. TaxID=1921583 RepID=UPI004047B51D